MDFSGFAGWLSAATAENTTGDPELGLCDLVRRWIFPTLDNDSAVTVSYPFVFSRAETTP